MLLVVIFVIYLSLQVEILQEPKESVELNGYPSGSASQEENGAYLAKHAIAEYLKALVTLMLVEKPADPFQWMRDQLDGDLVFGI